MAQTDTLLLGMPDPTHEIVADLQAIADAFKKLDAELSPYYARTVTARDASSRPTVIEYRVGARLVKKANASNPNGVGKYQTVVEQFYAPDGVTVAYTRTATVSYTADGKYSGEVWA